MKSFLEALQMTIISETRYAAILKLWVTTDDYFHVMGENQMIWKLVFATDKKKNELRLFISQL